MRGKMRTDKIIKVLLSDGWHGCEPNSFTINRFNVTGPHGEEVFDGSRSSSGAGTHRHAFRFRTPNGTTITGPLGSLIGVEENNE